MRSGQPQTRKRGLLDPHVEETEGNRGGGHGGGAGFSQKTRELAGCPLGPKATQSHPRHGPGQPPAGRNAPPALRPRLGHGSAGRYPGCRRDTDSPHVPPARPQQRLPGVLEAKSPQSRPGRCRKRPSLSLSATSNAERAAPPHPRPPGPLTAPHLRPAPGPLLGEPAVKRRLPGGLRRSLSARGERGRGGQAHAGKHSGAGGRGQPKEPGKFYLRFVVVLLRDVCWGPGELGRRALPRILTSVLSAAFSAIFLLRSRQREECFIPIRASQGVGASGLVSRFVLLKDRQTRVCAKGQGEQKITENSNKSVSFVLSA